VSPNSAFETDAVQRLGALRRRSALVVSAERLLISAMTGRWTCVIRF
jgi:hypothetical protein